MDAIQIQLVVPFHQPLSMSKDELARACDEFYAPFLERIERHPGLNVALHFGGHLLDYLSRNREDLLMRVRALHQTQQIEVLTGMFYGGLPSLVPEPDARAQLQMGFEYWESLLGEAPNGVWLPELAWTSDVPRLLSETEALYCFGAASQLLRDEYTHRGLGVIEHGGHRLAAYILDDTLSNAIVGADVDSWVDSVIERANGRAEPVISVWVDGERLGYEWGSKAWAFEHGWLDAFFGALSGGRSEIKTVRPTDSFDSVRPVSPLKLLHGCADSIAADANAHAPVDWSDFMQRFREVDTLSRRMLRSSDKLRDCVMTMEEEGLEDEWGDELATAQRLIFSAQTPDAYWRGRRAGFSDPKIRTATYERLLQAEALLDLLVQGDDDYIAEELDDRDGDLVEEVFVATRTLTAWINPAQGGAVRTLDDRLSKTSLLDVPPRRQESFFNRAVEAPFVSTEELESRGPLRVLDPLPRLASELPLDADRRDRAGTRDWLLDRGTSAEEFFSGAALDLTPEFVDWTELRNEIDEEGDLTYHLDLESTLQLAGVSHRSVVCRKGVRIPIDEPELHLGMSAEIDHAERLLFATEVPIRLGGEVLRIGGETYEPSQSEFHEVSGAEVHGDNGAVIRLSFSRPVVLWADRVRSTIKDAHGFRVVDQGLLLVIVSEVDGASELSTVLRVDSSVGAFVDEERETISRPRVEMPALPAFGEVPDGPEETLDREASDATDDDDYEYEYEYQEVEEEIEDEE